MSLANTTMPLPKTQTNRLINEQSPYLRQHAHHPVDWYPWSDEAFTKATKENKPIFLSIGYSTCHWCHVMAHESFEDQHVAQLLNTHFVCIKVDREERPDIDKLYMNVCYMITGTGGWPLTIIMTPDKKPFFAATYLPKETRYGTKGMLTLLPEISDLWKKKSDDLQQSATTITASLQKTTEQTGGQELTTKTLDATYEHLFNSFDEVYGGFGFQPKFPTPHNLLFLLRYWKRTGNTYCLKMVETTLEQMRMGGIYDHIGFGVHRYSTDRKWIVPHFEKMLYDQALLIIAYTEAYQATQNPLCKTTAQEIIEYVFRDMTSKEGGFYSAEDADSEGREGKFYTWTYEELDNILSMEDLKLITKVYSITKEGNFTPEAGQKVRENILYQSMTTADYAKFYKMEEHELLDRLTAIRKQLFQVRKKRIHPEKDDKILTDWNGLMIAALAKAAQVFSKTNYAEKAEQALKFLVKHMLQTNGELLHRYRNGKAEITGYADDYAFLVWGLIELYQTTFNPRYLRIALDVNEYLLNHFWDNIKGGLFFTSDKGEELLTRTKEAYDGAIPSANAVTMENLLRLARITGNTDLEHKAQQLGKAFSHQIIATPSGYTHMMASLDFAIGPSYEIVIVGRKAKKETQSIIQRIRRLYLPRKVVLLKEPDARDSFLEACAPFIKEYTQINNQATLYVCQNHRCKLPTTDIEKIDELLGEQQL